MIAIDRRRETVVIVDATVRFELQENQALEVNNEKKQIYNPTTTTSKKNID